MKRITIMQEKADAVEIVDANEDDLTKYVSELSSILNNTNVTILHTTTGSLILRPDRITSILVNNLEEEQTNQPQPTKEEKQDEPEDIITD